MEDEQVIVLIDDAYRDRFDEVVERARAAGLHVDQRLREIGTVSGSIAAARRRDLEQIQGIAAVEAQREIRIPPPENDAQ